MDKWFTILMFYYDILERYLMSAKNGANNNSINYNVGSRIAQIIIILVEGEFRHLKFNLVTFLPDQKKPSHGISISV
jgi:hypothetical protein